MSAFGRIPGVQSITITPISVRATQRGHEMAHGAVIDKTTTDSGSTPNSRIRPGLVVVLNTSTGKYFAADAATGDRNTAPVLTGTTHADGNGLIRLKSNHGSVDVTTATGAGTAANHATDLNANAVFAQWWTATSASSQLIITARKTGADEWMYLDAASMAGVGIATGAANAAKGTDADYGVLDSFLDLHDVNEQTVDALSTIYPQGDFYSDNLRSLTPEAAEVLRRNGAQFKLSTQV